MNDFQQCLEQSHAASDLPFWKDCYSSAFPTMIGMHDTRNDGQHQRAGVDRVVILDNGKALWVDEKVRGRNKKTGKVYDDIALEEWSDEQRKKRGWVQKPLLCDYIAYAIAPLGKCYLLPVIQLQSAWRSKSDQWKREFPRPIRAANYSYTTLSWGIPVADLFKAIGNCLRAEFTPCEFEE